MPDFFRKKEILPEVLLAYKWRFPDRIDVFVHPSRDGGYVAYVRTLKGCITEANTGRELFEMVNDAVYTYLRVPKEYRPFMPAFLPPEEVRKALNIKIPTKYLNKKFVLEKA